MDSNKSDGNEKTKSTDNVGEEDPGKSPESKTLTCDSPSFSNEPQLLMNNSPAYVKWDFDLPPAPEATKQKALQISREIHERYSNEKRRARIMKSSRLTPYKRGSPRGSIEDSPSDIFYINSIKKLKEAIGEGSDLPEKSTPKTEKDETKEGQLTETSCFFDDSFNSFLEDFTGDVPPGVNTTDNKSLSNDCLNESSRSVSKSDDTDAQKTPKSTPRETEQCTPDSPKARLDWSITPRNLSLEMAEDDDILFKDLNV